jgi:hypothetical protein
MFADEMEQYDQRHGLGRGGPETKWGYGYRLAAGMNVLCGDENLTARRGNNKRKTRVDRAEDDKPTKH